MFDDFSLPLWIQSAAAQRIGVFLTAFAVLASLETRFAQRPAQRRGRWNVNLALGAMGAFVPRLVPGVGALLAAVWAQERGVGAIPALGLAGVWAIVVAAVALDGIIYWQHRLMHRAPWLWRLHKVHHADPSLDVTTALRFHPLEILFSLGVKVVAVAALGAPPEAVIAFEIILNASAMFNHANLRLPRPVDAVVRTLVVTPAMHRVHHSTDGTDMNRNYGFCLSIWDRLFASMAYATRAPDIGLRDEPAERARALAPTLWMPFRGDGAPPTSSSDSDS